jgi:conjugative relaxase-like TrwC/TraI family protein
VLSVAKLRVGQEAYQLSGVAQSLDDYYTGRGEADGVWLGAGAGRLGLVGSVAGDDLRAVLAGMAPGSGGLTPDGSMLRTHVRRVPGFDLTFKAPKSVSVLYAVTDDPRVQGAIIEAGDTAVRATVSWIEREAISVRRGSGDVAYLNDLAARDPVAAEAARVRVLPGRGVVAAAFRHRTSRAGDPLLHWHTLVANLVEGPDSRWGAFVHPELYRAARAAGEVFQVALRDELTERLGLQWRPGRHVLEVAGVPQALCDRFSKRSAEIESWLEATGASATPANRQTAVLATRRGKPELEGERLDIAWKAEALAAGWGPAHAEELIAAAATRTATTDRPVEPTGVLSEAERFDLPGVGERDTWIARLGRTLTEHESTFSRFDVAQAVAASLGDGASVTTVDRLVAAVLASHQLVPVQASRAERFTTTDMLDVEHRFLNAVQSSRRSRSALSNELIDRLIGATPNLGSDQRRAVSVLLGSTDTVTAMVGPAGTGKTFTLDVVRRAYEHAGFVVTGAAPSARAAHELDTGAHIASSTLHRLVGAWNRGFELPDARTVLVVDEAGMAGIRDLERVVTRVVGAGGRVLLVGDHHQLPEVTAGGGFAAIATDPHATVAELTTNHRQRHRWERDALAELRDGDVARAVATYREHDRVHVVEGRASTIETAVELWLDAHRDATVPVLLAGTNELVDALNHAVRRRLVADGVLVEEQDGSPGGLTIGERLTVRLNDYDAQTVSGLPTAVRNGDIGTVVDIARCGVVLRLDSDGRDVLLGSDCLASGSVSYGYASTAHRAQGGTWDLAITVGLDGLFREAAYLVMSRGRITNQLVITSLEAAAVESELARHDSPIPLIGEHPETIDDLLLERLGRSRRKQLASTEDPHAHAVQAVTVTVGFSSIETWAAYARAVEDRANRMVGATRQELLRQIERVDHTARHAAVGHRVKAFDRRNIGTITSVDDHAGTVDVLFISDPGRAATRTLDWGDLQIVQPRRPTARVLGPAAAATRERLLDRAHRRLARWDRHLAVGGVEPDDRLVYERAARTLVDRSAALLTAHQPPWLTALLAVRPQWEPAATQVWDDTVHELAAARLRQGVSDPASATGPEEHGAAQQLVWQAMSANVTATRVWLDSHLDQPCLPVTRQRSERELEERRRELDAILATAPAVVREHSDRTGRPGEEPLDGFEPSPHDTADAQGQRRRWILEHWPHVVEAAEIERAGACDQPPADVASLAPALDQRPLLAAAVGERWLADLLAAVVPPGAVDIDAHVRAVLEKVAEYRMRWNVSGPKPLGDGACSDLQASERHALISIVNGTIESNELARCADRPSDHSPAMSLFDF